MIVFWKFLDYKTWYKLPNNMVTSFNAYGRAIQSLFDEDVEFQIDFIYQEIS